MLYFDMHVKFLAAAILGLALAATASAAPPVELELATERGVQITAPQQWLQLLTGIGIEQVQIRTARPGDEPRVENTGSADRPAYHVLGVVTSRGQLRLPGGTFTMAEKAKLKDFFDRLAADGAESLTAPRGRFGLTEKETSAVLADLAQSIDFETKGQLPTAIIEKLNSRMKLKVELDAAAGAAVREATAFEDELKGLTAGTGLAIVARNYGLIMRPEKPPGAAVVYRISSGDPAAIRESTLGDTEKPNDKFWPIGWEPEQGPGAVAPSLRESLNAEIGGYSLAEALAAITPRLKVPLYVDHASLVANKIDPSKVQIKLARARMTYRRLLDRVCAQALLGCSVRVDEAGTAFLWVTR
jgi:hypothetical protein